MPDLRLGQAKNEQGVSLFASENLSESGVNLVFRESNVVTESSDVLIRKVDSLPTPSSSNFGQYVLLSTDSRVRKCIYSGGAYSWRVEQLASFSYNLPLYIDPSTSTVSILGIDVDAGSEEKFLTEKGTFKRSVTLSIDPVSKHWIVNGTDTGVVAEGQQGPRGYLFTPSVSSSGIISWTNDGSLENPDPVNIMGATGQRGTKITIGTSISGTNREGQTFPDSGLTGALAGDLFLNSVSWNLYLCSVGGEPLVATWIYLGCLQGAVGPAMVIDATGDISERSQYDSSPAGFIFLTTDGWIYKKLTNVSGDWSERIQFKGDPFRYSDFTPEQLEGLRGPQGPKGDSPVIEIHPITKHWIIDGVDTGVTAEGTGDYSPGQGITIYGKTISIFGMDSSTGSGEKYLNQKGEWKQSIIPGKIVSYSSVTGLATVQPIDPSTGEEIGDPIPNLIVDWNMGG